MGTMAVVGFGRSVLVCAATLALAGVGAPSALASVASGSGTRPGTGIGNAAVLTGTTTGSLTTAQTDNWYVVYPVKNGGAVKFKINDTTPASYPCTSLTYSFDNTDGTAGKITSGVLNAAGFFAGPVSSPGSDRYYVEIDGANSCHGTPSQPVTYALKVVSGGGGAVPHPAAGTTKPGMSIGTVSSPLSGHTLYKGTPSQTRTRQAWYQLDAAGKATIRVADTTLSSANCNGLTVELDNSDATGGVIDNDLLTSNAAVILSVTAPGLYYLVLTPYFCSANPVPYTIEPEPATAWVIPAPPAAGTTKPGDSMSTVGPSLQGDTLYKGTPPANTGQAWYQLKAATDTGTIRIENTTLSSASCNGLTVQLDNASGTVDSALLTSNDATTFPVAAAGHYYLELSPYFCSANPVPYSIEPQPRSAWTSAPQPSSG
jgi:hypothetical protein